MQNIAKYANAGSASITLAQRNGSLEFRVRDDGRGFDPLTVVRGSGLQGMTDRIELEIQVPASFPKQYHSALIRTAELCKVKKTLEHPPQFEIVTREVAAV